MIGKKIKEARISKGLSQSELANLVYITKQSISKYENNKALPTKSILTLLEEVLGIKLEDEITPANSKSYGTMKIAIYSLSVFSIILLIIILFQGIKLNTYSELTRQTSVSTNGFTVSYIDSLLFEEEDTLWIKVSVYKEDAGMFNIASFSLSQGSIENQRYSYTRPVYGNDLAGHIAESIGENDTIIFWVRFDMKDISDVNNKELALTFNGQIVTLFKPLKSD